jgi:peptidoglycan hydrolase CwlO-like protein
MQAKLPHTHPTPAQCRSNLANALRTLEEKRKVLDGLADHAKAARKETELAAADLGIAEADLLASDPESQEEAAADAAQGQAWARLLKAEQASERLQKAVAYAKAEVADAEKPLRSAREDLAAVREGRRRR